MSQQVRTVFVTGGAGYIGSHCTVELLNAGYQVVVVDNFVNSVNGPDRESAALKRVENITGKRLHFYECDLLDKKALDEVFGKHPIDCVIHFAAIKSVGESMECPLLYHKNNLIATLNLLEVMQERNCRRLLFSSSCTVYGEPTQLPITEEHPIGSNIANVYGKTKYFIEEMLQDIVRADGGWSVVALRYFNPLGAHPSGLIGEDPIKPFANIMPLMTQVAMGRVPVLNVYGGDYQTEDGTGVRDYIHVMDLATGHLAALSLLQKAPQNYKVYNLGTGKGVSVLQLIKTFEKVTGMKVPYKICERREGDISKMYANADLAEKELGWKAKYTLEEMCMDFWRWQSMNQHGYRTITKITNGHDSHK